MWQSSSVPVGKSWHSERPWFRISNKFLCNVLFGPLCPSPTPAQRRVIQGPLTGGCNRRTKRGREELPHVRCQGQKPGGPLARRAAAKRSYPTSEVRGSGRKCQSAAARERPRGATLRRRSGAAAGGATHAQGQGQRPGGPAPCPGSRGCAGTGGPRGVIPR